MALTNVAAMATDIEIESMPNSIKHDINNATLTVAPQQQQQQAQQQQMTAIAIATTTPINTATIANVDVVGKSALPILSPTSTSTATTTTPAAAATTTKATDLTNVPSCNNPPATLALSSATANNSSNGNGTDNGGLAQGLSMMQSSPPPHSYRHSRAYRHFKNPPQPHMCIRTTTEAGEELFINVLSWTRIVIPQEPSDPIPLYGGMRVPPGSPRSPPIVFAVMANPEVLKDSGRHSKDPEERRAMVELMCDFVEAMNPGVKLVRNAVILKDRDISGELKDVWNAVQAQRDREREEQMLQQRQQQHYHNITTQQMFPKSPDAARAAQSKGDEESLKVNIEPEVMAISNGATSMLATVQQCDNRVLMEHSNNVNFVDAHMSSVEEGRAVQDVNNGVQQNGNESNDQTDAINKHATATTTTPTTATIIATTIKAAAATKPAATTKNSNSTIAQAAAAAAATTKASATQKKSTIDNPQSTNANHKTTTTPTSPTAPTNTNTNTNANANTTSSTAAPNVNAITPTPTTTTTATATVAVVAAVTPPTKKEKLGGFLPNGCIFPRFKNNKHKDKDKDKDKEKEKEKETKGKDKEKTLLNALKKSKEKKVAPIEQVEKPTPETDAKTQYEKNCINLENEVQKLDLNKIDASNSNDTNMFIKLKVAATSVAK